MSRIKDKINPEPLGYTQIFFFILIQLLLIFGEEFSKFHLFWQLHLYDLLLFILALISAFIFVLRPDKVWNIPVLSILGIGIIYLFYSYFGELGPVNYIIRHFALFLYLGSITVIFYSYADVNSNEYNINFLRLIGLSAFLLQIGYHVYNFIFTKNFRSIFFEDYNYISKTGFLAIFIFLSCSLVYVQNWMKWILAGVIFFLSFTLGNHSSAIITVLVIFGAYLFLHSNSKQKLLLIVIGVIGVIGLIKFAPQYFQDKNSLWRLTYWQSTLKTSIVEYYGILGHGFGVNFTTPELLAAMSSELDSHWMIQRPEEQYLTPMHNSLVTIAFHIGLIFVLVLFIPLKNAIIYFLNRTKNFPKPEKDFLVLSMLGVICFINFHVILEVPHSSALFWLIYFTTVFRFNNTPEKGISAS